MNKSLNICLGLCLISIIACFFSEAVDAQESQQLDMAVKDITGQVSFVDKDFISIIYKREEEQGKEYELVLYVDEGVILENITDNDLQKLNEEDIVRIEYTEINQAQKTKRTANKIRFIRKKPLSLGLKGFKQ